MTRCTRPTTCVAGQLPRGMEAELIVCAGCPAGRHLGLSAREAEGPVMAESRWPVVITGVLPFRAGMPLLPVLIVLLFAGIGDLFDATAMYDEDYLRFRRA